MKNMKQKTWSRIEEIELDDLYRKQLNYKDLAKKFSCTVAEGAKFGFVFARRGIVPETLSDRKSTRLNSSHRP